MGIGELEMAPTEDEIIDEMARAADYVDLAKAARESGDFELAREAEARASPLLDHLEREMGIDELETRARSAPIEPRGGDIMDTLERAADYVDLANAARSSGDFDIAREAEARASPLLDRLERQMGVRDQRDDMAWARRRQFRDAFDTEQARHMVLNDAREVLLEVARDVERLELAKEDALARGDFEMVQRIVRLTEEEAEEASEIIEEDLETEEELADLEGLPAVGEASAAQDESPKARDKAPGRFGDFLDIYDKVTDPEDDDEEDDDVEWTETCGCECDPKLDLAFMETECLQECSTREDQSCQQSCKNERFLETVCFSECWDACGMGADDDDVEAAPSEADAGDSFPNSELDEALDPIFGRSVDERALEDYARYMAARSYEDPVARAEKYDRAARMALLLEARDLQAKRARYEDYSRDSDYARAEGWRRMVDPKKEEEEDQLEAEVQTDLEDASFLSNLVHKVTDTLEHVKETLLSS